MPLSEAQFVSLKFSVADAYADLLREENIARSLKSTVEVVQAKTLFSFAEKYFMFWLWFFSFKDRVS